MKPALADETEAKDTIDEGVGKGFELPLPEQEDLRGMQKKEAEGDSDETEPAAERLPGAGDQSSTAPLPLLLPAARNVSLRQKDFPQPLPAVDPSQPPATGPAGIKAQEDAPPPLPESLKRFATRKHNYPSPALLPPVPAQVRVSAGNAPKPIGNTNDITSDKGVVPAGWQQPVGIRLINPAAALVPEATGDQLRQAIYYEATDQ